MRRIAICLYLVAGAWLVAGCGHRPPQQPQAYVTATLPALPYVTATLPPAAAPVAVVTVVVPSGQFRNHTAPDLSQYTPMPIPNIKTLPGQPPHFEVPAQPAPQLGSDGPPPGVHVNPNIPGNGPPPFPVVMYPVGLVGDVTNVNGELFIHDAQLGTTLKLLDPGNTLDGWVGTGLIDVSGVYDGERTLLVCEAVPYATVYPDGSSIKPRRYTKGACEMG